MAKRGKLRSVVRAGEYLVFRSAKTGRTMKHRGDVKLIAEVWSFRTKKRIRVLNNREKNGKIIPRRFARTQLAFYTAQEQRHKARMRQLKLSDSFKSEKGLSFPLQPHDWIQNQIPSESHRTFNSYIRKNGSILFSIRLDVEGKDKPLQSSITHWTYTMGEEEFAGAIASIIARLYRSANLRFSPKKAARSDIEKNWNMPSWMHCELVIWRFRDDDKKPKKKKVLKKKRRK